MKLRNTILASILIVPFALVLAGSLTLATDATINKAQTKANRTADEVQQETIWSPGGLNNSQKAIEVIRYAVGDSDNNHYSTVEVKVAGTVDPGKPVTGIYIIHERYMYEVISVSEGAVIQTDDPTNPELPKGPGCTWYWAGGRLWRVCD